MAEPPRVDISGPAMATFRKQVADISDAWNRVVSKSLARYVESVSLQLPHGFFSEQVRRIFSSEVRELLAQAANAMREAFERALPDNWSGFSVEEAMAVVDVMKATGICLVWTPRQDIVRDVLDDPTQDAFAILEARRAEILKDLGQCLEDVTHPELDVLRAAAREAIEADQAGLHRPAQALCGSVLTSIIHGPLEAKEIRHAHKEFAETHPHDAGIEQLRLRAIYVAAEMTLPAYNPVNDRPPHGRFNRHNTAHRVTATQFTPRNSLVAIMLIVSFLREMEYWLAVADSENEAA